MIPASALEALPPSRRASILYGAAQAELSQRLWQAALGADASSPRSDAAAFAPDRHSSAESRDQDSELNALLTLLAREHAARGTAAAAARPGPPAVSPPSAVAPRAPQSWRSDPAPRSVSSDTRAPCSFGANARYGDCIDAAAARTGIPPAALAAIVDAEAAKTSDGGWKLYSRNPRSSAAGLGQFLTRTWQGMAETPGTWLHGEAQARGWLRGGRVQAEARGALLALRYDATAAINGVADYARRNLDGLQRAGIGADDTRGIARLAYLGHHLGLGDAIRFMRDGGLCQTRAKTLLDAQIGSHASGRRIAQTGDATAAHRDWMLVYLDRQVRPERFARPTPQSIG
ncbi:peptidoglycan-binding protein [Sphingomonas sp. CFBP9019]|uniref:peptidoglycan-binding protein n=1 Tax=Sphingomonas sp. CFBP9019 TaxID=3096532 RepID=UPI002A6A5208|nr:peptidoglycan-binding protein [Sphingomonas sp. CFBP9019]MDY1009901.1 peptidoglycan-binding protein [Sphingomonas sp. CFBP9019]